MYTLTYVITDADAGRLLKSIVRARMGVSAHQYARAKALGTVLLDGAPARADRVVAACQIVSLTLVDDAPKLETAMDASPINIAYEDDDIIVIDKQAPLPTQSSPRQSANTLENRLAYYFRDVENYTFRPVNRLDKGTSGLMVVAKHAHAQARMALQLHTPAFEREYLAITVGAPSPASGRITLPIGKADGATVRREARPDGRICVTNYETLKVRGSLALVRLTLETGRTHQIRVHLSAIGCPVFGDFLYGEERPDALPGRFALHSSRVSFIHPVTSAAMEFTSPLPSELACLLK